MKKCVSLIMLVLVGAMLFAGCGGNQKAENAKPDTIEPVLNGEEPNADNADAAFFDISWTREADHDTETIRFGEDGSFSYSCGCGNPVNDSDLCEGYTYDAATKTITLDCMETTDEMVTIIKVVKCDENSLHLDFDGEIRIFEK